MHHKRNGIWYHKWKTAKSDLSMEINGQLSIIPGQEPIESTMWQHSKLHPICLKRTRQKEKTNKGTEYLARIDTKKDKTTVESIVNHTNCETTGKIVGYRDMVKMDALVWKKYMCNKLGRLYQGWKTCQNRHNRGRVPAQYFPFSYTSSYLSGLQSCKSIIPTEYPFILIFKLWTTQFIHWIVSCTKNILNFVHGYLVNRLTVFLAIELLAFFKNAKFQFYCSRELSVFGLKNK